MPMLWRGGRADKISNKLAGDIACLGGWMVEHQPRLLGSRVRFLAGAFAFFSFLPKHHFQFPFLLSLPLPYPFPPFLTLSLSLRPFVCAKKTHSSYLSHEAFCWQMMISVSADDHMICHCTCIPLFFPWCCINLEKAAGYRKYWKFNCTENLKMYSIIILTRVARDWCIYASARAGPRRFIAGSICPSTPFERHRRFTSPSKRAADSQNFWRLSYADAPVYVHG